jgi:hypothetical protein
MNVERSCHTSTQRFCSPDLVRTEALLLGRVLISVQSRYEAILPQISQENLID